MRRFRKVYIEVPKKSGKSTLAAGVAVLLLFCDGEAAAEVVSVAADREQARIVFGIAKNMIEASPKLSARCQIYRNSIVVPATLSSYKVLSADVKTKHGANLHGVIFDELHTQPSRELFDVLTKNVAARRQPVIFEITTAGDDMTSICREEHDYAVGVMKGVIEDDTFLPVIFAAEPEDDWREPRTWRKANPSLGRTVKLDYLKAECRAAVAEPRKQNAFKRLHLNLWTEQHTVWIPVERWNECSEPSDPARLEAEAVPCWGGVDLSTKLDLTACVLAFRRDDPTEAEPDEADLGPEAVARDAAADGVRPRRRLSLNFSVDLLAWFWIPEETMLQREKEDRVPYSLWAEQGFVRATPGDVIDYDRIYDELVGEILPRYNVQEIGFDPYNATQFSLQLQSAGFRMVEVRQGVQTMCEPSKVFEALVRSRRLRHGGHPVLRWNVANVAVREDKKENIFPHKPHQKKRIDGVIGSIIALSRMIVEPSEGASVYEERGILTL